MTVNNISTIRKKLQNTYIGKYPLYKVLEFIANLFVIPAFTFQMFKIIRVGKVTDFSKYFIFLQLIGAPEGGGGFITGLVKRNWLVSLFGGYGLFYYLVLMYYYFFPRK